MEEPRLVRSVVRSVVRRLGAPFATLVVVCAGGCATPRPAEPLSFVADLRGERCGAGPGPIEILASDVAIVIDRSTSTRAPTGLDIDGDGVVGEFRRSEYTDRGDSMLVAQLAAVARLVEVTRLGGMRFAIVSFSGRDRFPTPETVKVGVDRRDARLEAELTDDSSALSAALERIARRGSDGSASYAPAMRLALRSLDGDPDRRERRRRVFFLSDSSEPLRFAPAAHRLVHEDFRMQVEAYRALAQGIRFHSFGIGSAAEDPPPFVLAQIAGATGGVYRAVPDPRDLYCHMLIALGPGNGH